VTFGVDIAALRHPWERPIWFAVVVLNALICGGAIAIALNEGAWVFSTFPMLARYEAEIRGVALAAVLTPPALVFSRNRRLAKTRGGGLKVSSTQYAPLHQRFLAHCEKLGVGVPPTLYVSEDAIDDHARGFSAWHREYVVLGTDYLEKELLDLEDVWSFLLGRELGRLALGHVRWWDELLVSYVERIPWIRRPLRHVRVYSLDRVGAFLEPQGVRGVVIEASGRRVMPSTNIAEQIRYALSVHGFWVRISNLVSERPLAAVRLQLLYKGRLLDLDRDLERFG
jgi:hypothetical protein